MRKHRGAIAIIFLFTTALVGLLPLVGNTAGVQHQGEAPPSWTSFVAFHTLWPSLSPAPVMSPRQVMAVQHPVAAQVTPAAPVVSLPPATAPVAPTPAVSASPTTTVSAPTSPPPTTTTAPVTSSADLTVAEAAGWEAVENCEEGPGTAGWATYGATYEGGLGFLHATWDQYNVFGYPADAADATPTEQMTVAQNVVDHIAGGVVPYAASNCAGYRGW